MVENYFMGYCRENGKVGVRNKVAIISTVQCSAIIAEKIADLVGGVFIVHQQGCMQLGKDLEQTERTLLGLAMNPNVGAVLVVGLGCEKIHAAVLAKKIKGKPVDFIDIQQEGGSLGAISTGASKARKMTIEISKQQRTKVPISKLVLAVKCGGSDPYSGLAVNPALGIVSDLLIEKGGSVIMGTESLYGSEYLLAKRAVSREIGDEIIDSFLRLETDALALGYSFSECNPTPGNIVGGITTMAEKSLGAMRKGGKTPIVGMLGFGEIIKEDKPGLWLMDTRGGDISNDTGYVSGGAQVIVFTTGRMTPVGDPIAPVIKATATKKLAETMSDNIDISVHEVIEGKETIVAAGERLYNEIIEVANGKKVSAEVLGHNELYIPRIGSAV